MIFYFSGIGYPPEKHFKGKCALMLTYFFSKKKPEKRFLNIVKKRKKKHAG